MAVAVRPCWRAAIAVLIVCVAVGACNSLPLAVESKLSSKLPNLFVGDGDESAEVHVWVFLADKNCGDGGQDERSMTLKWDLSFGEDSTRSREAMFVRAQRRRAKVAGVSRMGDADIDVCDQYARIIHDEGSPDLRLRVSSRWLNAVSISLPRSPAGLAMVQRVCSLSFVHHCDAVAQFDPVEGLDEGRKFSAAQDDLKSVSHRYEYGVSEAQVSMLNLPAIHDKGFTGKDVLVLMLDSGFNIHHECLRNHGFVGMHDFVEDDSNVGSQSGTDPRQMSHGTATMSCVGANMDGKMIGTAPDVNFMLAKTEDIGDERRVEEDWFVAGVEWGEAHGADVLSASLGYTRWYTPAQRDGKTAPTSRAVNAAIDLGMTVVLSAGNSGSGAGSINTPADAFHCISVGAVDSNRHIVGFSSRGPTADGRTKPEICALGNRAAVAAYDDDSRYTTKSGTSFSCPLSAGMLASMVSAYPHLNPFELRAGLLGSSGKTCAPDNSFGFGVPDASALYLYFAESQSPLYRPVEPCYLEVGHNYSYPFIAVDHRVSSPSGKVSLELRVAGGALFIVDKDVPETAVGNEATASARFHCSLDREFVELVGTPAQVSKKLAWLIVNRGSDAAIAMTLALYSIDEGGAREVITSKSIILNGDPTASSQPPPEKTDSESSKGLNPWLVYGPAIEIGIDVFCAIMTLFWCCSLPCMPILAGLGAGVMIWVDKARNSGGVMKSTKFGRLDDSDDVELVLDVMAEPVLGTDTDTLTGADGVSETEQEVDEHTYDADMEGEMESVEEVDADATQPMEEVDLGETANDGEGDGGSVGGRSLSQHSKAD